MSKLYASLQQRQDLFGSAEKAAPKSTTISLQENFRSAGVFDNAHAAVPAIDQILLVGRNIVCPDFALAVSASRHVKPDFARAEHIADIHRPEPT
jgi:hypothetical protein